MSQLKERCKEVRKRYDLMHLMILIPLLLATLLIPFEDQTNVLIQELLFIVFATPIIIGFSYIRLGVLYHMYYRNKTGLFLANLLAWFLIPFYEILYYWLSLRSALKKEKTEYLFKESLKEVK